MWDQLYIESEDFYESRIIPTYVGSTAISSTGQPRRANHSHVCGINLNVRTLCALLAESFPRMWDQPQFENLPVLFQRIIPTYVGSTRSRRRSRIKPSNHSHVCGINLTQTKKVHSITESFPRMWDQHPVTACKHLPTRIIPTYVGSTQCPYTAFLSRTNHSHVCGINSHQCRQPAPINESFPRMWDQRVYRGERAEGVRIIPTYVGSTHYRIKAVAIDENHSHVCGING